MLCQIKYRAYAGESNSRFYDVTRERRRGA